MWTVKGEIRSVLDSEFEGVKKEKVRIEYERKFVDRDGNPLVDFVPYTIYTNPEWESLKPHVGKVVLFPMDVQVNSKRTYISAATDGSKPKVLEGGTRGSNLRKTA